MTTENILSIFKEIMKVPRESGHEEQIIAWLQKRAAAHNLECKTDQAGNVLIIREASKGCESSPTIILQSHSDMVCEKNAGVEHDFSKDPIVAVEEDGWLIAKETTLGADCGIGMAAQLAVLEDDTLQHGRIEALFTTSEETGLTGAKSLEKDFISGKILINLDSEDEGELFIGCAGGVDTTAVFKYGTVEATKEYVKVLFRVYGAEGGHSGDDIDKNRANAVKILARLLYQIMDKCSIELYEIDGGNKKNAIAREAYAAIGFDRKDMGRVMKVYRENVAATKAEFALSDKNVEISAERIGIEDVDSGKMLEQSDKRACGDLDKSGLRKDDARKENCRRHKPEKFARKQLQLCGTAGRGMLCACRSNCKAFERISRMAAENGLARCRCDPQGLQKALRKRACCKSHPCRARMRPLPRQISRSGHDFVRAYPQEGACPGREARTCLP